MTKYQLEISNKLQALQKTYAVHLSKRIIEIESLSNKFLADNSDTNTLLTLQRLVHGLAGSGATFGCLRLSEIAQRFDQLLQRFAHTATAPASSETAAVDGFVRQLKEASTAFARSTPPVASARRVPVICLMEQDQTLAEYLVLQLDHAGYRVRLVDQPEQVLHGINRPVPEALLLGTLPAGCKLTQAPFSTLLAECRTRGISFFVMANHAERQVLHAAAALTGAIYVDKPVQFRTLLAVLAAQLSGKPSAGHRVLLVSEDPDVVRRYAALLGADTLNCALVSPRDLDPATLAVPPEAIVLAADIPVSARDRLCTLLREHEATALAPVIAVSADPDTEAGAGRPRGGSVILASEARLADCLQTALARQGQLQQALRQQNTRDLVTDLHHRDYFLDRLGLLLARQPAGQAVLYIELDRFAEIQRRIGDACADILLRDVADLLNDYNDETRLLARFGPSAFVLLTPADDTAQIEGLAETIREELLSKTFDVAGTPVHSSFSMGIYILDYAALDPEQVVARARSACARAAADGGNQACLFDAALDGAAAPEIGKDWRETICHALKHHQFQLNFQPIVAIHGEFDEQFEVLLRLRDGLQHTIPASAFIAEAERAGLGSDIDQWVIEHAVDQLELQHSAGKHVQLFINLSKNSIESGPMQAWITAYLKQHPACAQSLVFELRGDTLQADLDRARAFVDQLHRLQVGAAVDQVGPDSDIIELVRHVPFDYIKIDSAVFTEPGERNPASAALQALAALTRERGTMLIATRVQNAASLAILWKHGVQHIQGYFTQAPDKTLSYAPDY